MKLFSVIIAISSADQKLVLARMEKMNGKQSQKNWSHWAVFYGRAYTFFLQFSGKIQNLSQRWFTSMPRLCWEISVLSYNTTIVKNLSIVRKKSTPLGNSFSSRLSPLNITHIGWQIVCWYLKKKIKTLKNNVWDNFLEI